MAVDRDRSDDVDKSSAARAAPRPEDIDPMRILDRNAPDGIWSSAVLFGGVSLVVIVAGLVYLGGQTSTILSTVGTAIPPGSGSSTSGESDAAADQIPGQPGADQGFAAIVDAARPDLLVIRTGVVELRVADLPAALDAAARQAEAAGGYVAASEQSGTGPSRSATVTYRIPAATWDRMVTGLDAIADDVVKSDIQTQDVTANVVDLEARIANLRATEGALQSIMATATSVKDVLAVQAQLTEVRGKIEEAVARRDHLKDQAAFSTITVHFGLPPVPAVDTAQRRFDPTAEVDRSVAQLVRIGQRVLGFGIWFAIVGLPILLTVGIGVALVYVGRRWYLRMRTREGI